MTSQVDPNQLYGKIYQLTDTSKHGETGSTLDIIGQPKTSVYTKL